MKLYKVGEKSQAICHTCNQVRQTTFKERDVSLNSEKRIVQNVLVAVCTECDTVVSIPQQSVPKIQEIVSYSRHAIKASSRIALTKKRLLIFCAYWVMSLCLAAPSFQSGALGLHFFYIGL